MLVQNGVVATSNEGRLSFKVSFFNVYFNIFTFALLLKIGTTILADQLEPSYVNEPKGGVRGGGVRVSAQPMSM